MPIVRTKSGGDLANAAAVLSLRRNFVLAADATVSSDALSTQGLPRINFYANQTVGAAGAQLRLQFMPRMITGGATPDPEWLLLQAPIVLTPGGVTPTRVEIGFAVAAIRIQLTRSPGVATTVQVYLSAAGSS